MVSKKHQPRASTHISSAASLSISSPAGGRHASAVLKAAFAPSALQLSLFASVILGLDGQQLQVHDTQSHRLLCQHRVPKARITTLDWGFHSASPTQDRDESPRKRKRIARDLDGAKSGSHEIVIGFGTDQSEISFFCPTTSRITTSLKKAHTSGVKEFRFQNYGRDNEAWSLGGDKNLIQWDLSDGTALR